MPDPPTSGGRVIDARFVVAWLLWFADLVDRDRGRLTELDTAIGDGDHGINLARGMAAVRERVGATVPDDARTARVVCRDAAMALISTVGGASGPLYGTFLMRLGGALPDAPSADLRAFVAAVRAGVDGVVGLGHAEPGDKTMVDALLPAVAALEAGAAEGNPPDVVLRRAAEAAATGSDGTIALIARKGRASYLGERSRGHLDPGAASTALLFEALADPFGQADDIQGSEQGGE